MAKLFSTDSGSTYLYALSAPVTTYPMTMGTWFYDNDTLNSGSIMSVGTWASYDAYGINSHSDEKVQTAIYVAGATYYSEKTGVTNNKWEYSAGVFASSTDRKIYLNGGDTPGTDTADQTPANADRLTIGSYVADGSYGRSRFKGGIAESAMWDVALTAAEIDILAAGYSPLFVRPQNLVFYAPLIRGYQELIGGLSLVYANEPADMEHPPIIYPAQPIFHMASGAAVTLSVDIGMDEATYQGTGVRVR